MYRYRWSEDGRNNVTEPGEHMVQYCAHYEEEHSTVNEVVDAASKGIHYLLYNS